MGIYTKLSEVQAMKRIVFEIEGPGELAAGIRPSYDQIAIEVVSGDPGGAPGEFEAHMAQTLREWYDDAKVIPL